MFTYLLSHSVRAQKLCESGDGRPGLPVPNNPKGLSNTELTERARAQELCEGGGGRPYRNMRDGEPRTATSATVSVDVKQD